MALVDKAASKCDLGKLAGTFQQKLLRAFDTAFGQPTVRRHAGGLPKGACEMAARKAALPCKRRNRRIAAASTVAGVVDNYGALAFDPASGDGGSSLSIGSVLTNSGTLSIGPTDGSLSSPDIVSASSVSNSDALDLDGGATAAATLDVAGAAGLGASGVLSGDVNLTGDALLEFASGEISTLAANSELSLGGPSAFVADSGGSTSDSALTGLATIDQNAALTLDDGASVSTAGALTNNGAIGLVGDAGGGGSQTTLNVNGALSGSGTVALSDGAILQLGAAASGATIAFGAGGGAIDLATGSTHGATLTGFTDGDTIDCAGVAYTSGDTVNFANVTATGETVTIDNASATAIASFAVLGSYTASQFMPGDDGSGHLLVSGSAPDMWLVGNVANWATDGDWSGGTPTAMSQVVVAQGDGVVTAPITVGSIAITDPANTTGSLTFANAGANVVTGNVTNVGALLCDASSSASGQSLSIGSVLTNSGTLSINQQAGASPSGYTVSASAVDNSGSILLEGSAPGAASAEQATFDVTGAAGFGTAGVLSGSVVLFGDALIEFASGEITTLAADSLLELTGSNAVAAVAGSLTSDSALTGLATIDPTAMLVLAGGASVSTAGAVTNDGVIGVTGPQTLLNIQGALSGSGTVVLSDDAILRLRGSANNETIAFGTGGGTIDLTGEGSGSTFTPVISGFTGTGGTAAASDVIEVTGLDETDHVVWTQNGAIGTLQAENSDDKVLATLARWDI